MAMPHLGPLFQACHTPVDVTPNSGCFTAQNSLILSVWMEDTVTRGYMCGSNFVFGHVKKSLKLGNWTQLINIRNFLPGCVILDLAP